MKKANGLFIGLLFIVVGFLYACSALDFIDFSIFFPGWWTLFIIVPCLYALTRRNEDKTGPVIGLIIGICFLINAQDIDFHIDFFPMALAVLCILIGWKLIFPGKKKEQKHVEVNFNSETGEKEVVINDVKFDNTYTKNSNGYVNASAILGGKDIRVDNECFTGADICVVMGAIDLNLRNAIISEDVYINVSAVMGGIDIYVPANVRVVTDGCSTIMGGIDVNTSYANFQTADTPRVIITGSCVMGGIDIQ
ncbi:MAG: hypothetical protein IJ420_13020 [Lachnospiraceae bacterium]|nr:hypothetical protein [Lachnospiraceae bacterium]